MALQPFPEWAPVFFAGTGTVAATTFVIDATTERAVLLFMAPKTGNVDRIEFNVGAVTNSPDNGLRAGLQSVNMATGLETGTWLGATANGFVVYPHTVTTGWKNTNFTEVAPLTFGGVYAAVIDIPTFTASDNVGISAFSSGANVGFPYGSSVLTTKVASSMPIVVLHYMDGYEELTPFSPPCNAITSINFHSGTAVADEWGMAFQFPYPVRLSKVASILAVVAAANYDWVLYDSSSNVITGFPVSVDGDVTASTSLTGQAFPLPPTDLTAGALYRLTVKPSQGAATVGVQYMTFADENMFNLGPGAAMYMTSRLDGAGSWTNYNNVTDGFRRPRMYLGLSAHGDDVGGGGGGGHFIGGG